MQKLCALFLAALALAGAATAATMTGPTDFHTVIRSGDTSVLTTQGYSIGTVYNDKLQCLKAASGACAPASASADFTSFLEVDGKRYLVTQFESSVSSIYMGELATDATGKLSMTSLQAIDLSSVWGSASLCAGSHTPWNTHLGGEEWDPDARVYENATTISATGISRMLPYFSALNANSTVAEFKAAVNPYMYGRLIEVKVQAGKPAITKWMTLGRRQNELAYVMPDRRTVFLTDDGTNKGLTAFVMDTPGDLSSGSMYAFRFSQTSTKGAGSYKINPIFLAHGKQEDLMAQVKAGAKFSDIFFWSAFNKTSGKCADPTHQVVNAGSGVECLKLKVGMESAAAFHETRRYSAMMGATVEWNKMEGFSFDAVRNKAYIAFTSISYGMERNGKAGVTDVQYDIGGNGDVALKYNDCGVVMQMDIAPFMLNKGGRNDQTGVAMFPTKATEFAMGNPLIGTDADNECDVNNIASPDNVAVIHGLRKVLIAEDTTTGHQNDALWTMDQKTGALNRIMTTVFGGEVTSVWWQEFSDFTYLIVVVQHPYGESDEDKAGLPGSTGTPCYIGYIGPIPTADLKKARTIDFQEVAVPRGDDRHKNWGPQSYTLTM